MPALVAPQALTEDSPEETAPRCEADTGPERVARVAFADASVRNGIAVSAFFASRTCFGATIALTDTHDPFMAEAEAAALAGAHVCDGGVVYTDSLILVRLMCRGLEGKSWRGAAAARPRLVEIRRALDAHGIRLVHSYGHGERARPGTKFVDILSRGLARRSESMGLADGDVLLAGERLPHLLANKSPVAALELNLIDGLDPVRARAREVALEERRARRVLHRQNRAAKQHRRAHRQAPRLALAGV